MDGCNAGRRCGTLGKHWKSRGSRACKTLVGPGQEGRSDSDDSGSDRPEGSAGAVEEQWIKRWAFGTSQYGLGLDASYFWSLTHREVRALREVWEQERKFQIQMFAQLRADIHNGWMPKKSQAPWTAAEFGGEGQKVGIVVKKTRAEWKAQVKLAFGRGKIPAREKVG